MDARALCGLLNLNKPTGITSRAALDRVARPLRRVKVGHAGTLDPLASGVLVVAVGPATRLIEYVQEMDKAYRTTVLLGATSPTDDADGEVTPVPGASAPAAGAVEAAVATQVGWLDQRPPEFSALKVAGERSYDLARAGRAVTLAARPVRVDSVRVVTYEWPRLVLEIVCGSGTYVRSIARDIGAALGCGGLVEVLTRTRIGPFTLADALDPLTTEFSPAAVAGLLRPALDALAALPRVAVSAGQVADLVSGRAVSVEGPLPAGPAEVAVVGPDGALVAVGELDPGGKRLAPRRVLVGPG